MIEILFGESEATAMKIAIEKGVILGSIDKVICLELMLDIGDIREEIDGIYRKQLIFDMYTQNGYYKNEESLKEFKKIGIKYIDEQNRFRKYLLKGEQIRIWYSNAPYAMCGLYYICSI